MRNHLTLKSLSIHALSAVSIFLKITRINLKILYVSNKALLERHHSSISCVNVSSKIKEDSCSCNDAFIALL